MPERMLYDCITPDGFILGAGTLCPDFVGVPDLGNESFKVSPGSGIKFCLFTHTLKCRSDPVVLLDKRTTCDFGWMCCQDQVAV